MTATTTHSEAPVPAEGAATPRPRQLDDLSAVPLALTTLRMAPPKAARPGEFEAGDEASARPFRRLGWAAVLLLLLAALLLVAAAFQPLSSKMRMEADTRALLLTESLAKRVQRAVTLGIPLAEVQGLEPIFAERMQQFDDILALALRDPEGRLLAIRTRDGTRERPAGSRALASVRMGDRQVAHLVLVRQEPRLLPLLLHWSAPLLSLVLAWALLADEALRQALRGTPRRRDLMVGAASRRLVAGDFGWRMPLLPRREFDLRPQWLAAQLRQAQERQLRIRRLVQSLRVTEAEAERRHALDRALEHANGMDRFTSIQELEILPLPPRPQETWRWWGLLLGLAAWVPAWLVTAALQPAFAVTLGWRWPLLVLVSWLLVALALGLLQRRRAWLPREEPAAGALLAGAARGLLAAGPGLFLFVVRWLQPEVAWPRETAGTLLAGWSILACTLALAGALSPLRRRVEALAVLWRRRAEARRAA